MELLDTDQTAGLGVLVVGVLTSQTVEPTLDRHQLAAELSEGSGDVPVVFSAHLNVAQFPGFLNLQTIPWTAGLSPVDVPPHLVGDVLPELASVRGVGVGEEVHLVSQHHHRQVSQAS